MNIDTWIENGEMDAASSTMEEVIEEAGTILDRACISESFGTVRFVGDDGQYYEGHVEFVITKVPKAAITLEDVEAWFDLADTGERENWFKRVLSNAEIGKWFDALDEEAQQACLKAVQAKQEEE